MSASFYFKRNKSGKKNWIAATILIFGLGVILWSLFLFPGMFASSAILDGSEQTSLSDPLLIKFSNTMIPQSFVGKVRVSPEMDLRLQWQNKNRELAIFPAQNWKPETEYRISIEGVRNIIFCKLNFDLTFKTVNYPQVTDFFPAQDAQGVVLDIEDPIAISFENPISEFWVKVTSDPAVSLETRLDVEKNKLLVIPQKDLEKGKTYSFSVLAKGKNEVDEAYRTIFVSSFSTKPEVPKVWASDFSARLNQAKALTEAQITEGKYIDINLKSQVMTIFENGQAQDAYIISSGKRGMDTPQGTFRIANKFPKAWSQKYGLFMPFWMAIVPSGDFGIHELPEWPSGYKEGANHLGTPVSHGCVRLGVGAAERVYNWAIVGTPVVIHT